MNSKLIVMLTQNDRTVRNAIEVFKECCDLPIDFWGFKNIGIPEPEMRELVTAIKTYGKKSFLEVVTYTEESCAISAKFACENHFDFMIGTTFFPRIWDFLQTTPIQYYPFVGNIYGNPSVMSGNVEDMVKESKVLGTKGIHGINVLAYRYIDGNPVQLAQELVKQAKMKTIIAGSIDSISRIKEIDTINPWAFTIGGALFTDKFVSGAGFRSNLEKVLDVMDSLGRYDTELKTQTISQGETRNGTNNNF